MTKAALSGRSRIQEPVGKDPPVYPPFMTSIQGGEDPNNLMPCISQVAIGKLAHLQVFGDDYPTKDGTSVRDYIHVVDLSRGHVKALEKLADSQGDWHVWSLGVGKDFSVLEMVKAFKKTSGWEVPYVIGERRTGDIAACYACPEKQKGGWAGKPGTPWTILRLTPGAGSRITPMGMGNSVKWLPAEFKPEPIFVNHYPYRRLIGD